MKKFNKNFSLGSETQLTLDKKELISKECQQAT